MRQIDLLRHGEAATGLCLGKSYDPPLTTLGWTQMTQALPESAPWSVVISSPSRRCAEFATQLAAQLNLPCHLDERLQELGFGLWEGRPWAELYAEAGETLIAFQTNPTAIVNPAPQGETYAEFERRIANAWADWANAGEGGHSLIVTHAGVIREILRFVIGFPAQSLFRWQVPLACTSRLSIEADGWATLNSHGQHWPAP